MLLNVKDAGGNTQQVYAQAQDVITDASGPIAVTGVSQALMQANANRSGWYFQNQGSYNMTISELGNDATLPGAWVVPPLGSFPPPGFPIPTGLITVAGTVGDIYTCRQY